MKKAIVLGVAALLAVGASAQTRNLRDRSRANRLNINTRGDAETCADLKVTSEGELARSSEMFRLSRAEAPTLELDVADRGVVSVRGGRQDGYTIEACKVAVAEDRGMADMLLRGIAVSRSAGRFGYTGPSSDSGNWQVYFIIHTPDNASLDLETKNAPVAIANVNGNIKVRATNGPLSIHGSTGNIDAQSDSGPISFDGEGGEVHLNAHNGPISVRVEKDIWNGSTLDVRTVNGPMSVSLPPAFQSGMRVETSGHAPFSCRHEVCNHAYSNQQDGGRVMQMNGSNDTVKISTGNGPLSINEAKLRKGSVAANR